MVSNPPPSQEKITASPIKDCRVSLMRLEDIKIYKDIDYNTLSSLSAEAVEKLSEIKPTTIGQASRISGVSPSDINVIAVFIGR